MHDTREIPKGQDNEAGQRATNVHEDKGKPPLLPKAGNTGKKGSFVWGHFTVTKRGENLGQLVIIVAQPMLVIVS